MAPTRLHYDATPLRLAASLGSTTARDSLSPQQRETLDDAFAVLMSCSETLIDDDRFDFSPPRYWPYTLQSAMRMAVASFRAFVTDWDATFSKERANIPDNVPEYFPRMILGTVGTWLIDPLSYEQTDVGELYGFIKDEVCLDGYLSKDFPKTPAMIGTFCIGSLYLIGVANCQPGVGPMTDELNLSGIYCARMPDAIGQLLYGGTEQIGEPERLRFRRING